MTGRQRYHLQYFAKEENSPGENRKSSLLTSDFMKFEKFLHEEEMSLKNAMTAKDLDVQSDKDF